MFVGVDGQRNPLPSHIALNAVHRREGAFVRIDPGTPPAVRIVNVGHQHTAGPAPLEPVMVGAIQLEECPHVSSALPPRPMGPRPPCDIHDPARPQPPSQGLVAERDPVALGQRLGCQRWSKIPLPLRIQPQRRGLDLRWDPSVRGRAPSPMRQPPVARLLKPLEEAPDVAGLSLNTVPAWTCVSCCSLVWRITDTRLSSFTRMMTLSFLTIWPSV